MSGNSEIGKKRLGKLGFYVTYYMFDAVFIYMFLNLFSNMKEMQKTLQKLSAEKTTKLIIEKK